MMPASSTAGVRACLKDPGVRVIDVRASDAYNGWALEGEPRGGHIPGASNLPRPWIDYIDWPDIVAAKGLTPDLRLVLYGSALPEIQEVAAALQRTGLHEISTYPHFATEWLADEKLPLERLARYAALAPVAWLREASRRPDLVLCHCHYRNPSDYASGHIPGAIALDTLLLEAPETWNRRPPEELRRALASLGITRQKTVVLYGRDSIADADDPFPGSSAGQLAAMRCAFIMLYCGVEDVKVLNGGLGAWERAGFETTTEPSAPTPSEPFGGALPARPELAVDMPEAKRLIAAGDAELVDIRSRAEFEGRVSGYNYIHRKGRIPGAVFAGSGSDAYHVEGYRNLDLTMREADEIAREWRRAGLSPEKRLAFFCGTGWRASEAFFAGWLMGWPRVAVYDGGWFEWSNDTSNPIETGAP